MSEFAITGSTGVIGRRAVRELLAAGHRVTGVTRSARGRELLERLGARGVEADVFSRASPASPSLPASCYAGAGFFLIPVIGFLIDFPLGVYLEERRRLGPHTAAWHATREALRAMGLSIVIELSATVLAAGAWPAAVLA